VSARVSLVWTDDYIAYDFGEQHPLQPIRVKLTVELIRALGLDKSAKVILPRPATRAELESIHSPAYIDAVMAVDDAYHGPFGDYGYNIGVTGDNPAFPHMHDASALVAGGAIVGAEEVWSGRAEHAFVPAGGLHHAMREKAWGFCIYNDPALAIRWLLENGAARVAYVDVDVHHGDGVQAAFYDDPRVLTISLHETGSYLFPGTGFAEEVGAGDAEGTKVNVALPPFTFDDAYRRAFERVVPPLVESFKPDVLVTQLGCDTHATDPLAHFALTTRTYRWLATQLHQLAHSVSEGRWLATGGGGYQLYSVVPRAWTIYFADMVGQELPDEIPSEWLDRARAEGGRDLPTHFEDPEVHLSDGREEEIAAVARAATEETVGRVFGYHGLQ
jgi:acetoin utilization protein AcuC